MDGFRQDCIGRKHLVGSFCAIPHPVAVEVMALSGLDFLCIDWEHAQMSRESIEALVRAADVHRVPAMVRVPGHQPEAIAAALDAGAQGILVPRVSTAAQARTAVRAAAYPPKGERGIGPGRAAGYGYRIPDYLAVANARTVVAVQVETAEGLANIAEIVAVEGVDVVFVGPGDLSVSIGAIGPEGAAALSQAIRAIIAAAVARGRTAGIFCARVEDAGQWAEIGASFFILASDTMFLGAGASSGRATAHARLEQFQQK